MHWYQKDITRVFKELETSLEGLSKEEAEKRLKKFGPNELVEKKKKSPFIMFLGQFRDFMIIVLIVAAVISALAGDLKDTITIAIILILNAIVGFVQEFRAEKAMEALKRLAAPSATVIRDGLSLQIKASELVPGDLVVLEAGAVVPADLRLVEAFQLRIDEAPLTGESFPVVIYLPFLNQFFRTAPLSIRELSITILLSSLVFFVVELEKMIIRRLKGNSYNRF